ncbi:import receptor subunit tom40 [Anaeramoeba flamelloides]|uniref:Import receptor subunit tom40 n=1 Tax=Anaeramoeba flamelloides TaxID=1746091 RepID=A0AAV7YEH0_9EUKA|nr:import receptor subunit tom40 [Anaeramoeba flamelloides]
MGSQLAKQPISELNTIQPSKTKEGLTKTISEQQQQQQQQQITKEHEDPTSSINPGRFDNILRDAQSILGLDPTDGVEFKVNQQLNPFFSLIHTLRFGSVLKPPAYVLSSRFIRKEYAFLGDLDQKGRLAARFFQQTTPKLLTTAYVEIDPEKQTTSTGIDLEYYSSSSTSKLRIQSDKTISASYLQTIFHPNLISGLEFSYLGTSQKCEIRSFTRLYHKNDVLSLELSDSPAKHFKINYVKKITDRIGFATDFIYNLDTNSSHSTVGIRYSMRKCRFSTLVRSSGSISSMYEELFHPLGSLKINGEINYQSNHYFFGFSFRFGPDI